MPNPGKPDAYEEVLALLAIHPIKTWGAPGAVFRKRLRVLMAASETPFPRGAEPRHTRGISAEKTTEGTRPRWPNPLCS